MCITISGRQIEDFKTLSSRSVTSWDRWCSGQIWRWLWSQLWSLLSVLVAQRCTCFFLPPACSGSFCGDILYSKTHVRLVLTKHGRVSFNHSLHLVIPSKPNTPQLLYLDLGTSFLDSILYFLYPGVPKPYFGHFGHIQGKVHIGLFQRYMTSMSCHCSYHVEYLQEIRCCFKQWTAAIISTIFTSIASSMVINASFFHLRGAFSRDWSATHLELMTWWCSISQTVETNALVDHGGFLLCAEIT